MSDPFDTKTGRSKAKGTTVVLSTLDPVKADFSEIEKRIYAQMAYDTKLDLQPKTDSEVSFDLVREAMNRAIERSILPLVEGLAGKETKPDTQTSSISAADLPSTTGRRPQGPEFQDFPKFEDDTDRHTFKVFRHIANGLYPVHRPGALSIKIDNT